MNLIYQRADINNINDLVDLRIKQILFFVNRDGLVIENEKILRENIKKILLQELNKTIFFFIAIDKNTDKVIASNCSIVQQVLPSNLFVTGKRAYITSVYTDDNYRRNGIQDVLMKMNLDFLKELNCFNIELDASNPPAIKLYEKFGFKKIDIKYVLTNL